MICPYCQCESTPIGCGDEVLDFCGECGRVIEGETEQQQNFGGRSDLGPVLAEDATYAPAPTDKA